MSAEEPLKDFEARVGDAARFLRELANEKRLMILCALIEKGELSVLALAAHVGLSQSALSQHLARLREQGIVDYRRAGATLHYSVINPEATRILETLKSIYC